MNVPAAQDDKTPGAHAKATTPEHESGPRMKFTYASGSRPLEGYTIKRGIGRGGFGEVYYAVSDGGKEVALKLIRRNFDVELRGVAQCLNLKHPNLLGLHDVRADDQDDRWVVMEYVTGECLEDAIVGHAGGMPEQEANAWMHGIASGVAYLHECGIVHRDLKPGNIFSDNGLVKIGDYGLSKFLSCSRRSGQTESVGTVHYMAPEIANGRYGKEIDIYAMGVMLYEMLTGQVPFDGESVGEVLMKHLTAEPDLSPLSEPYRSIVGRALAKDPGVRYSSASELLADLPPPSADTRRIHLQPRLPVRPPPVVHPVDEPVVAEIADGPTAIDLGPSSNATASERPEEPIMRWVKSTFARFGHAWSNNFSTAAKVVFIVLAVWLVLRTSRVLFPTLILLTLGYLVYRTIWTLVTWSVAPSPSKPSPATAAPQPAPQLAPTIAGVRTAAPPNKPARRRRRRWHQTTLPVLPVKSNRDRASELSGSLVLGALVCLVTSLVMLLLRGEAAAPEQFAWLAIVSILGTWGILIPAKFWEGKEGEPALRRFCMLVAGLLVGVAAFGVQQHLWVSLPHEFTVQPVFAQAHFNADQPPTSAVLPPTSAALADQYAGQSLMTCLSYFGFLFLLARWWRLADPLRATRLSLWATALCVTWAGALYLFWPFPASWDAFPQPWGFMFAATVAVAVQLSSPWLDRQQRGQIGTA